MNPHMIKRFGLPPLLGLDLFLFLVATSANAEETRSVTNLKGETVIVPGAVPKRETLVFLNTLTVRIEAPTGKTGLLLVFYNNPTAQGWENDVETYDLAGNLLKITWSHDKGQVLVAHDSSLTDPGATEPARVLVMDAERRSVVLPPSCRHF